MTMTPASLLAKLDELKRWQQVQQQRLLKQHQTRLQAVDSSEYPIQDDLAVTKKAEEMKKDVECKTNSSNTSPGTRPKQPFLKRGTGLAKYGLQYGDQKKPVNKMKPQKEQNSPYQVMLQQKQPGGNRLMHNALKEKNTYNKDVKMHAEVTPLKVPEITIKQKAKWCSVEPDGYKQSCMPSTPALSSISSHNSNDKLHKIVEADEPPQNANLQALQNNPALLQCLQKLAGTHFGTPSGNGSVSLDQTDLLNKLMQLENDSLVYQTPTNNNHTMLVQYLQDLLKRCETNKPGDLTSYENALEKELRVFEQLEEKVLNSSFSSTNSSVVQLLASTPHCDIRNKVPTFETIQEGCNARMKKHDACSQAETLGDIPNMMSSSTQNSFTDSSCTLQSGNSSSSNVKKMLVYPEVYCDSRISVQIACSDESSINSDDLEHGSANIPERIVMQTVSTMTELQADVDEGLLKEKLRELEAEITSFRSENRKLEKAKGEVDRERVDLQKAKKALEKEYGEKCEAMEVELDSERKRLRKEKMVFEKYAKQQQDKPTRKEREEISNLKAELAIVRDTLKVKESRSGTTQARLRTQIKSLEKDNAHLKEEVEKLQKANARLQNQMQMGRRSKQDDTKMLHEINRNLSKLANDQKVAKSQSKLESAEDSQVMLSGSSSRVESSRNSKGQRKKTPAKASSHSENESSIETEQNVQVSRPKSRSKAYQTEYARSYSRSSYRSDSEEEESRRSKSQSRSQTSMDSRKSSEQRDNESSCGDITTFRNLSDLSVAENYEKIFGGRGTKRNDGAERHNSLNDTQPSNGKVDAILADGSRETKYPNGNVKIVSPDGNLVKMTYFNGDIKETALCEGTIKYFYMDTRIWQTTFPTGDETFEFPDGQIEKHFHDGSSHVQFPNGIVKQMSADGSEQINYPDGSIVNIKLDGERVLLLPNGQKEIHTDKHKRREYPDGTVKIIYTDGLQETRYSNGRIRMKDKDGVLIMDSHKA